MANGLLLGSSFYRPALPIPSTSESRRRSGSRAARFRGLKGGFGRGAREWGVGDAPIFGRCSFPAISAKSLAVERIFKAGERRFSLSRWNFAKVELSSTLPAARSFGIQQARPFLLGGFVAGLAMAVSTIISSLAERERRVEVPAPARAILGTTTEKVDFEERLHVEAAATPAMSPEEEERIAKIRDMARQATLDENALSAGDDDDDTTEESLAPPLRLAAAARVQLLRKQNDRNSLEPDFIGLSRQLDLVRESDAFQQEGPTDFVINGHGTGNEPSARDETNQRAGSFITTYEEACEVLRSDEHAGLPGSSGSETMVINGHGTGNEPSGRKQQASAGRTRFITTYEEACEVLRADKHAEEISPPTSPLLERPQTPQAKALQASVEIQGSENLSSAEAPVWKKDEALRYILLRAQENERRGKPLFHGMPPDSRDILFNGLEKELGKEAEPIKAWIMERISSDAQKKSKEQEIDDSFPMIPGSKSAEWKPDCNPQKTVVTGSSSGAVKRKPAGTDQADLKKKKQQSNNKKVWPKEIQRRYDTETDPKMRKLLKEIGKDLDEWLTEEEVEETLKLFFQGPELLRRWHAELKEEAREQGETLGDEEIKRFEKMQEKYKTQSLQSLASKYRDSKPFKPDTLWWCTLRYVACIMLHNEEQKVSPGLHSMNMALEGDSKEKLHVVGFEDHKEALNFCRTLVPEVDKLGGATGARVIPLEPKELLGEANETGFQVTVLKKGQVENYAGKPLEEVEHRILEIGRDVYVQEKLRERSIDVKSMMKDLWSEDY